MNLVNQDTIHLVSPLIKPMKAPDNHPMDELPFSEIDINEFVTKFFHIFNPLFPFSMIFEFI